MGPQVACLAPYAVSMSVYLSLCLTVCLPTQQSAVNGQTVSAKMMGVWCDWGILCLSPEHPAHTQTCANTHTVLHLSVHTNAHMSTVPACVIIIFINYVNSYVNTVVTHTQIHTHTDTHTHQNTSILMNCRGARHDLRIASTHKYTYTYTHTCTRIHTGVWQWIAEGRKCAFGYKWGFAQWAEMCIVLLWVFLRNIYDRRYQEIFFEIKGWYAHCIG